MHDKFTERVRKVIYLAREEAARLQHDYIGTEHLLLGVIREGEGIAATVLNNLGVAYIDAGRWDEAQRVLGAAHALDPDALTLGFARRLATYKRLYLLTYDRERSVRIMTGEPPVQLLLSGKAHPLDEGGKGVLQDIFNMKKNDERLAGRVVVLEDYDLSTATHLVSGCDVWVNLPRRPQEASGTSGMKACFNGVLQLSVLDGWWAEAYDGGNGWAIPGDEDPDPAVMDARDAADFYDVLEREVIPMFYDRDADGVPHAWCDRMKESLASNVPRFSATRMVDEYAERIYPAPASR